jgi:hypothetical protein
MDRIRALAITIVMAGGTLLLAPSPAHSTYDPDEVLPKRCCGGDVDGDGELDFRCCTRDPAGCSAGPAGCIINQT